MSTDKVYIIAEAGVNHNGSLVMAKQLIDEAKAAGADAVKFQTFSADALVSAAAPKAEYQHNATDPHESQYEMLKKLELTDDMHFELLKYCQQKDIQLLSTPFDSTSADFLIHELNLPRIKISSGEILTAPLLIKIAQSQKPVILSTGMATLEDIEMALGVLAFGYLNEESAPNQMAFQEAYHSQKGKEVLQNKVTLLHCTSAYPADYNDIHLRAIKTMREAFNLPVGYSDHSLGINVSIAAVALGAAIIEKHFTLDKNLPGPDHQASLDPEELYQLVKGIRQVEMALGNFAKKPNSQEYQMREVARKSLVALCEIKQGEIFSEKNLGMKRPGTGISPLNYWDFLGRTADKNYAIGELIHG